MNVSFFTNEGDNTLINKIAGVFKHRNIHFFDALVGYFRASGYFQVRPFIEKAEEIRILVGIDVDNLIHKATQQGLLFDGRSDKAQDEFYKYLKKNVQEAAYDKKVEDGMLQMVKDIVSGKVQIRIHPEKNIHAKLYIFREKVKHTHGYGTVITGSSNLTKAGLSKNFEFNVELRDDPAIEFATKTFEDLWKVSVPLDISSIEKIQKETYLNDEFTPYQIYLKLLIEYFDKSIEFDPNSITDLPRGFKKLSYQVDAVNDGYSKMIKHNGFFLSDVVGLGKTIVSILIAKKHYYSNGFPEYRSRTLIILPPALKESWEDTIEAFGLDNYDIVTNGSLHKIKNIKRYDLIIVDEAHKFRTDTAEMYKHLQKITKSETRRVLPDGTKIPKRVILVSATPLNNKPEDIANLVYLFKDSKDSSLEVGNLQHFFRTQIDAYKRIKKEPDIKKMREGVKRIYERIRVKVIEPLIVRRTRKDLLSLEPYRKDLEEQGIEFPKVGKPIKIFYSLEPEMEALYDYTIQTISHPTKGLTYNRYRAIGFLKPEKKAKYNKADLISAQLAMIMKTQLVKRIDSSFYAFTQSLKRFLDATQAMVSMFNNGRIYIAPNLPVSDFIIEGREEELLNLVLEKSIDDPTIEICEPSDFEASFYPGLKNDLELLEELYEFWRNVDSDPKLDVFIHNLKNSLFEKSQNLESKLIVFSESKETTDYLIRELPNYVPWKLLAVDSKTLKDKMPAVRANFDANIPVSEKRDDYDILITTEVLAEGVNLHRSNIVVNYDTPWNSTRLMQRIGRVNRIGTNAKEIFVYNFYPTAKVEKDIELEKKAIMKLQAFHAALGEDSQIYSPDEEPESFGLFDKEIEDEKDEKLAYLMFIRKIKEKDRDLFKQVKDMPLRSRVGRLNTLFSNSTICYIKDSKRDAFIHVNKNNELFELTFLEAVKIFEADMMEMAAPIHEKHHEQVQGGILLFSELLSKTKAKEKKVDITQGPNETKAIRYLDALLNLQIVNEEERALILKAKEAVLAGRFQNLQRDINKFQRKLKKAPLRPAIILEKIIEILKGYPLNSEEEENTLEQKLVKAKSVDPEIIISESFSL